MKNSKKIIFASALTLALSVGTILPENVKADDTNPTSSEQKVDDTVTLDLYFKLGNKDTELKMGNNVADINGIPYSIDYDSIGNYPAKRGTTLNIKVKNSSEAGAKYYAEGTFDVPKEGYKYKDDITIILKEINSEVNPTKPDDKKDESTDKKENDDKDNNVKPEDNKDNKDKNTEVENKDNKENISDNKEEKDKKENISDNKEEDKKNDDNKTENKNDDSNIDTEQKEDDKNKDSSSQKGSGMGEGSLKEDLEFKTYDTKEEAIEKAKEALKNNDKYNHYEIKTTEDGKYYYELSKKDKEDIKTVPVQQNNPKKVQTTNSEPKRIVKTSQSPANVSGRVAKSNNVQTGVSSLTSIVAIASTSLAALILSKKNK
ncbi:DUF5633 domain-containing protein [Anaerococcus senegalensis]|uniref:DUF5633 domain-containing protein n=1 Tax=Anaerococcus senegalensis TaxID=1288120 RepID=UPI000312D023|nr:DUF5633 domain-containing protein [Anaerococcus senegalensis]